MESQRKPLKVGVAGLCHLHPRSYMPVFGAVEDFTVTAAADANTGVLDAFAKDFPVQKYADWREMIEREQLDLAAIFLPHVECPEAAVPAPRRASTWWWKSPWRPTPRAARRMIAAAAKAGVILSTPYVWRYHPVARQMKKFMEEGVLGRIVGCEGRCAAGRLHRYIDGNAGVDARTRPRAAAAPCTTWGCTGSTCYRWLLERRSGGGRSARTSRSTSSTTSRTTPSPC